MTTERSNFDEELNAVMARNKVPEGKKTANSEGADLGIETSISINYESQNQDGTIKRWSERHEMIRDDRERKAQE